MKVYQMTIYFDKSICDFKESIEKIPFRKYENDLMKVKSLKNKYLIGFTLKCKKKDLEKCLSLYFKEFFCQYRFYKKTRKEAKMFTKEEPYITEVLYSDYRNSSPQF
jgi:hypothetical protein